MPKYNHAYSLGFSVDSDTEDGSDVTADQLRQSIRRWIDEVSDDGLLENCDAPWDTYEIEDDEDE